MAIEIVDFPIKHGDFPVRKLLVYQAGYPQMVESFANGPGQQAPDRIGWVSKPSTGWFWSFPF